MARSLVIDIGLTEVAGHGTPYIWRDSSCVWAAVSCTVIISLVDNETEG